MGVFSRFLSSLGIGNSSRSQRKPALKYADSSYDPKNLPKKKRKVIKSNAANDRIGYRKHQKQSAQKSMSHRQLMAQFSDLKQLKGLTFSYLQERGKKGAFIIEINGHVAGQILKNRVLVEDALSQKKIRDQLSKARRTLGKEGKVGYNRAEEVWYPVVVRTHKQTAKESRYLKPRGLDDSWVRLPNKIEAIKWLHLNFTPDEFEQFCCAILGEHCGGKNFQTTEKRKGSGADGGIDGVGEMYVEETGKVENIAFEAKRYKPSEQLGSDICQKLVGAMQGKKVKYGFIITTCIFSKNSIDYIETINNDEDVKIKIEMIDQERLAEIMIYKKDSQHGFGLHRTEEKHIIYMNEGILRNAVKKR